MIPETLKERYDVECPNCKTTISIMPSLFMHSGINRNIACCKHCKHLFKTVFDDESNMVVEKIIV